MLSGVPQRGCSSYNCRAACFVYFFHGVCAVVVRVRWCSVVCIVVFRQRLAVFDLVADRGDLREEIGARLIVARGVGL